MAPSATTTSTQLPNGTELKTTLDDDSTHASKLYSSGGPIDSKSIGQLRSTDSSTPLDEIRRRYAEEGYVWLKGLLPATAVWKARRDYFEFLQPTGLLKKDTDPQDGIYCGGDWRLWMAPGKLREAFGLAGQNLEYEKRVVEAHGAPWYTSFTNHPVLKTFIESFAGWDDATLLQRSLFRPNVPGGETTQVHYDQIFLRGGPPTALTAWVPLGDCLVNGGGLLYLEDSVSIGQELERGFAEAAKEMSQKERISAFNANMSLGGFLEKDSGQFSRVWGRKWLAANYEAGDVVLHNVFNIHCSAVNETDVIRLATDLRFVETGKPFDQRWMKTWEPDDGL